MTIEELRAEREALYAKHDQLFREDDAIESRLSRWMVATIFCVLSSVLTAILTHIPWFTVGGFLAALAMNMVFRRDTNRWERVCRDVINPNLARVAEIGKEIADLKNKVDESESGARRS